MPGGYGRRDRQPRPGTLLIYLDTSVVVSLLCADANSVAAATLMQRADEPVLLTSFAKLETVNALNLRLFRKEISAVQAAASIRKLEERVQSGVFRFVPLPDSAYQRGEELAHRLTPRLGVHSADLLHVAAALELGVSSLYSFDHKQRLAAEQCGLLVNSW